MIMAGNRGTIGPAQLQQAMGALEGARERALERIEMIRTRRLGGSEVGLMPEIQRRIDARMGVLRERHPMLAGGAAKSAATETVVPEAGIKVIGTGWPGQEPSSPGKAGGVPRERYYPGKVTVTGASEEARRREVIVRGVPIKLH